MAVSHARLPFSSFSLHSFPAPKGLGGPNPLLAQPTGSLLDCLSKRAKTPSGEQLKPRG